jgi:hypothetical protein
MAALKFPDIHCVKQLFADNWLGRKDSNLRIQGPKPCDLPLVDAPVDFACHVVNEENQASILNSANFIK